MTEASQDDNYKSIDSFKQKYKDGETQYCTGKRLTSVRHFRHPNMRQACTVGAHGVDLLIPSSSSSFSTVPKRKEKTLLPVW